MPYTALRFDTEDADAWSDALLDAGALSVEVSDPHAGSACEQPLFGEPGDAVPRPWARSQIVALFAGDADAPEAVRSAACALGRPIPRYDRWPVDEQDWVRATQAQFGPIRIADRLHIVPSWCEPPAAGVTIVLDPGLAFGTGAHPTTRLCLEWLIEHLPPGAAMLDYGCGSGILAIAAAKLGASRAVGVDIDAQALAAASNNARVNRVAAAFVPPDRLGGDAFDVVVANILTNTLVRLAPALAALVRPGGRLALAGILDAQAAPVIDAYARWFTLDEWRRDEGWALVAGERRAAA